MFGDGYIDAIIRDAGGNVVVIDFKTASKQYGERNSEVRRVMIYLYDGGRHP